tara:strand:- start:650 stop:1759 length:1110 start_codon:yes stop_codon:yes gene_type:complete
MALWGISTTQEAASNNYAIPKWFNDSDRSFTPHNCFADERGWIYRRYQSDEQSGLSTTYYDEVIVPVAGLNTTGYGGTTQNVTGLGTATPVAFFFEDPNKNNPISVNAGGTDAVGPDAAVTVHLVYNENVFVGKGTTIKVRTFDINGENESDRIIGYATSATYGAPIVAFANTSGVVEYTNFNGQIGNRIAFALTAPTTPLQANLDFTTTSIEFRNTGVTGIGTTVFYVANLDGVSTASSITVDSNVGVALTNAPIISVGSTSIIVGLGMTIAGQRIVGVGSTVIFSNRIAETKMVLDLEAGVVGTVTSFYGDAATKVFRGNSAGIDRQVGGAGTFMSGSFEPNAVGTIDGSGIVGLGTTTLQVNALSL